MRKRHAKRKKMKRRPKKPKKKKLRGLRNRDFSKSNRREMNRNVQEKRKRRKMQ